MVAKNQAGTKVVWKQLLFKADELKGAAGGVVYDRTSLLLQVFEDADFRSDNGITDDQKAASILDSKVSELFIRFLDLKAIRERFPDRDQWVVGDLRRMHAEVLDNRNQESAAPATKRTKRKSVKVSDHKEVLSRAEKSESRADALAGEVSAKSDSIVSLERRVAAAEARETATRLELENVVADMKEVRRENDQLRADLTIAEGRISEFESSLTAEPAAA